MEEIEYEKNKIKLINNSFYITYVFLMTTATITFIEAIRTKDMSIRQWHSGCRA